MKLSIEHVENGYLVTDESGKKWIAVQHEYVSLYALKFDRVVSTLMEPADEPAVVSAPPARLTEAA